jgi:hypothetical protein
VIPKGGCQNHKKCRLRLIIFIFPKQCKKNLPVSPK